MIEFTIGQAFLNPVNYIKNVHKSTVGINHPWLIDLTQRIVAATSGTLESGYRCGQFGVKTFKALLMDRSEFLTNLKKFRDLVVLTLFQPVCGLIAPETMVKFHEDLGLFPVADEKKTPPPPPQPPSVDPKMQKGDEEKVLSNKEESDPNKLSVKSVSAENVSLEAADKAKERSLSAIQTTVAFIAAFVKGFMVENQLGWEAKPALELIPAPVVIYCIIWGGNIFQSFGKPVTLNEEFPSVAPTAPIMITSKGAKERSSGGSETKLKLADARRTICGLFLIGCLVSRCLKASAPFRM